MELKEKLRAQEQSNIQEWYPPHDQSDSPLNHPPDSELLICKDRIQELEILVDSLRGLCLASVMTKYPGNFMEMM